MYKQDHDILERSYERMKLQLIEDFLKMIKLKEETYAKLTGQLIKSIQLERNNTLFAQDLNWQSGWIKELESVIPKDMLKKLHKKYDHIFHASMSHMSDELEEATD